MLQRELRALLEMEGKKRLIVTHEILKGVFQPGGKRSQVDSMERPNVETWSLVPEDRYFCVARIFEVREKVSSYHRD